MKGVQFWFVRISLADTG